MPSKDKWAAFAQPAAGADKWAQYAQQPDLPGAATTAPPPAPPPPIQPGNAFTSGHFMQTLGANAAEATAPLPPPQSILGYLSPSRALHNFGAGAVEGLQAIHHIFDSGGADQTTGMTPEQRLQFHADAIANQGQQQTATFAQDPVGAYARAAGQQAPGLIAGAAGAELGSAALNAIPSRVRAGASFQTLNRNLADQPVPLKASLEPLQRAAEVGVRGSTLPKAVSDLLTRSQSPIEMTFPEARDYQSSLSDLSASDKMAMNGRMRGAVAQLSKHLYSDIYDAADSSGMGPHYAQAMKEYGQAATLAKAQQNLLKYGAKAALYGAGAGGLYGLHKAIGGQ